MHQISIDAELPKLVAARVARQEPAKHQDSGVPFGVHPRRRRKPSASRRHVRCSDVDLVPSPTRKGDIARLLGEHPGVIPEGACACVAQRARVPLAVIEDRDRVRQMGGPGLERREAMDRAWSWVPVVGIGGRANG